MEIFEYPVGHVPVRRYANEEEAITNDLWLTLECASEKVQRERGVRERFTIDRGVLILTDLAIEEVWGDILKSDVPVTVRSFAELHDYVDANGYGLAFDWVGTWPGDDPPERYNELLSSIWNRVQDGVDRAIKADKFLERLNKSRMKTINVVVSERDPKEFNNKIAVHSWTAEERKEAEAFFRMACKESDCDTSDEDIERGLKDGVIELAYRTIHFAESTV